ncbi:MAG: hypothetical protein WC716_00310 [Chitinophagaceae bacterium]|jgi:hypothetical protein
MLNTPVLLIVFNRPSTTQRVFDAIRVAKPKQLFVAADGARKTKDGEEERCAEVRKITTQVDWDCEVKTLFSEENQGCGLGPFNAITWFFQHVEQGIILEDDCLPDPSFFPFCEQLLHQYKDDLRINSIAGTNVLGTWEKNEASYFFSVYSAIWGWATWKRAWAKYDFFVSAWSDEYIREEFLSHFLNKNEQDTYRKLLTQTHNKEIVSWWDYQLVFARIISNSFGIVPHMNLVSNIGFGPDATHTFDAESASGNLKRNQIKFPLKDPIAIINDTEYDKIISETSYREYIKPSMVNRVKGRLKRIITKRK